MSYAPHEHLVAPARPSSSLTRLVLSSLAIVVLFVVLSSVYAQIQVSLLAPEDQDAYFAELAVASTPRGTLANLFVFALMTFALWIVLWVSHRRGLLSLFGPLRYALVQFWRVTCGIALLYAVFWLLPVPEEFRPTANMTLGSWLALLPLALIALLIQVSAEELVFRGYLQSQLAARFSHPVIWIGVPSLLFAVLHYGNIGEGGYAWIIVVWTFLFGIVAADLTARSGTLGPAIALHFMNNFTAILLVAPEGNFDGLALYTSAFEIGAGEVLLAWMPVEILVLLCSWLTARIALRL